MRGCAVTGLRKELFVIQMENSWHKLPGEVAKVGLVHESRGRLGNTRFPVFEEVNV